MNRIFPNFNRSVSERKGPFWKPAKVGEAKLVGALESDSCWSLSPSLGGSAIEEASC